jgi:diaminohydroxyphosphoribosylaminopyrimidine deaminase/5-amino-6-(5-phosphoribosylamino)uracil reductase
VLLRAGLVDRLAWFHAPSLIGGDGIPAVAGFGLQHLEQSPRFERVSLETVGDDVLETLRRR